jgi:hypothetical protein
LTWNPEYIQEPQIDAPRSCDAQSTSCFEFPL